MKVMVISDIHGDIDSLRKVIELYKKEKADNLIILGDFAGYFHSSTDYEVADMLNEMAASIIAVKGNCDSSEIDKIFNFSLGYLKNIKVNQNIITITHGHMYNRYNLPSDCGKIFLFGHTHFGIIEKQKDIIIANPGSISKPRAGSKKTYIIIDENNIILKELNGETVKNMKI
jgi:putative phosphoesterase